MQTEKVRNEMNRFFTSLKVKNYIELAHTVVKHREGGRAGPHDLCELFDGEVATRHWMAHVMMNGVTS